MTADVRPNKISVRAGSSLSSAQQGPRGHACTICRRRKLKCGGEKPACLQCVRGSRTQECFYEDYRETPTNKLNARITELQAIIDSYERALGTSSSNDTSPISNIPPVHRSNSGSLPPLSSRVPLQSMGTNGATSANGHAHAAVNGYSAPATSAAAASANAGVNGPPASLSLNTSGNHHARSSLDMPPRQQSWGASYPDAHHAPPHHHRPTSASADSASAAYLRAHAAAFSTLGVDPVTGAPARPGAQEEWDTEVLPPGINQQDLFTVFMGHRHQGHFDYVGTRLIQTLSRPSSSASSSTLSSTAPSPHPSTPRPHPALINAIYLFASHFSRSAQIAPYDSLFLARARAGMQAAISQSDRLLDIIQAGCLVSLYLYFKSRVLEGYMLGGAVARLAIALGLHQIESPFLGSGLSAVGSRDGRGSGSGSGGGAKGDEEERAKIDVEDPVGLSMALPTPNSLAELGVRIHTFWQVWCVDKYAIMSTGLPCSLPDDQSMAMFKIKTVLPPRTVFFTKGMMGGANLERLSYLYDENPATRRGANIRGSPGAGNEGIISLGYKAVELFSAAIMVGNYKPSHGEFIRRYRRLDSTIERFSSTMPPISYREDDPSTFTSSLQHLDDSLQIETRMVFPHLLLLSAKIALYSTLAERDEGIYERRLACARASVGILRRIQHYDANYHEVSIAPAWKHVSETLLKHVKRLRAAGEPDSVIAPFEKEADASTQAMQKICHLFADTAMKCWDELL